MNAEIMQQQRWPEWVAGHIGATEFRPEPSVVAQTAGSDMIGMCVLPKWSQDDLRSNRSKNLGQFPSRIKVRLQTPIGKIQMTAPSESKDLC